MEKGFNFQHQLFVQKKDKKGDYHFVMKGSCTREHVTQQENKLFLFIRPISHIKYMIKNIGGLMDEIHWSMEERMIFPKHFHSSLLN
jgi:hypothetical protein